MTLPRTPAQSRGVAVTPDLVLIGLLAAVGSVALGALAASGNPAVTLAVPAGLAAAGAFAWSPAIAPMIVLVLGGVTGASGAHWLVPGLGLPVFEVLLVSGAAAGLLQLAIARESPPTSSMRLVILTLPSAFVGMTVWILNNHSDTISGLREAMLFFYPILVALPLVADPHMRRVLQGSYRWLVVPAGVALTVAAIGGLNFATGHNVGYTSTGELRALGSSFGPPLAAGLFVGMLVRAISRGRSLPLVLMVVSVLAFFVVNHRSAYIALIISVGVVALARTRESRAATSRELAALSAVAAVVAGITLLTPFGHQGKERFLAAGNFQDPNTEFRVDAARNILSFPSAGNLLVGRGVGLQPTDLTAAVGASDRTDPHDSYLTALDRGGIVGLCALLLPLVYGLSRLWRARSSPVARAFIGVVTFTALIALFNVALENSYFGIWLWAPLAAGVLAVEPRTRQSVR